MKKILVLGATSTVAVKVMELFSLEETHLFLMGRSKERLENIGKHLKCSPTWHKESILDYQVVENVLIFEKHHDFIHEVIKKMGGLDLVFVAYGHLGEQKNSEKSGSEFLKEIQVNFLSIASYLHTVANYFESQKNGQICVITSVAGDRARKSNYTYGVAKGALSLYLQGLRNRLFTSNVSVTDIKLGFVDTPMTEKLTQRLLMASPKYAAMKIVSAISQKKEIAYVPFYWRYIMLVIKGIPERIFKKLNM
ncbi:MAG: SDR family NAD(P)-dependent oxidoreductase [Bacteriovoracaceae bacterium]|nr:SDR family NAD(P)-dependent oxidoreductase [Bacteriovoracaceae bacterium]